MNKQIGLARACITSRRGREREQRERVSWPCPIGRTMLKHRDEKNYLYLHLPNMETTVRLARTPLAACSDS